MTVVAVGLIGCGYVANEYLGAIEEMSDVHVARLADVDRGRAEALGARWGVSISRGPAALLEDPSVDLVLNLTPPAEHHELSMAALAAGKHVYSEKPLGVSRAEAQRLVDTASAKGLRLGAAPDTFLGPAVEAARQLLEDGVLGTPMGATFTFTCGGHERWHPRPAFYYQPGGGPVFDMGPYYLTTLVCLLGPIRAVTAIGRRGREQRVIAEGPRAGSTLEVFVPTHVGCLLEFDSGAFATGLLSFDVSTSRLHGMEVHGTDGALRISAPESFDATVEYVTLVEPSWRTIVPEADDGAQRGLGLADMATAILEDKPHRATGEFARHVVDVMEAIDDSIGTGERVALGGPIAR